LGGCMKALWALLREHTLRTSPDAINTPVRFESFQVRVGVARGKEKNMV